MEVWKEYKLGEVCTKIGSGATPKGGKESYLGGNISLIRSQNVLDFTFSNDGLAYISDEQANKLKNVEVKENDVLLNITGDSVARACIVPNAILPARVNQHVAIIRGNESLILNKFILYGLQYKKQYLLSISQGGGTRNALTKKMIEDFVVKLPNIETQQKIANILSSLDDKIEVNRRINEQLEELAQALFKSWFVDNRQDNWEIKPLSEIIYFQEGPGIRNWQYVEKDGVKFINIRCINNNDVVTSNANMISCEEANGKYAHFMLNPMDIVMSCSGTLGRYAIIRPEHLPLCLNTSVIRFRPCREQTDFSYVYGYLTSKDFLNKQIEMACGSVQANFGPTHLKQIKMLNPPISYCKDFHEKYMPIISLILNNRQEIHHLTNLRDTLLPKLMSGEIDVNEVEI